MENKRKAKIRFKSLFSLLYTLCSIFGTGGGELSCRFWLKMFEVSIARNLGEFASQDAYLTLRKTYKNTRTHRD